VWVNTGTEVTKVNYGYINDCKGPLYEIR